LGRVVRLFRPRHLGHSFLHHRLQVILADILRVSPQYGAQLVELPITDAEEVPDNRLDLSWACPFSKTADPGGNIAGQRGEQGPA
jgi:hypothetical protein